MDKIRNFEEIFFREIIISPLPRPQQDLCECVTSMNFQGLLVFLLGKLGGGFPIENRMPTFLFSKNLFFLKQHGDL